MHMRRAVLVAVLLLALQTAAIAYSSVFPITHDQDADAETSIAIDPTNPNNVIAAWIEGRRLPTQTCGYGVTHDGGVSWTTGRVTLSKPGGGEYEVGTDPSVTFDRTGSAYLTCLAYDNFPPGIGSPGAILVWRSTNAGTTWGTPVIALAGVQVNHFQDHQFITSNPYSGDIYITETQFTGLGKSAILFLRSTDQSATWSAPVRLSCLCRAATFQDSFSAARDPSTVYVVWGAYSNAGLSNYDQIYMAVSRDGGVTFSAGQKLATIVPLPDPLPNGSWRTDNNLWVAVSPAGELLVNYSEFSNGDADIRLLRVADTAAGFTVLGNTRVNDDPVGNGADQFFPFVTVAGGRVDVCFQDRRYVPGNALMFTTCAFSFDGGQSFVPNQRVTDVPFDASNNGTFIGDYNWQASSGGTIFVIFPGDGVPGADANGMEIFVARVTP